MGFLWWVVKVTFYFTVRVQVCAFFVFFFLIYVVIKEGMGYKNGMEAAVVGADYFNLQKA